MEDLLELLLDLFDFMLERTNSVKNNNSENRV